MPVNYAPLIQAEIPNFDELSERESDGSASAALILMAVSAWAEAQGLDPEVMVAEIVDRAEAIAGTLL